MEREWWGLPGPALFSSRVAADLREGKNVVVYMPTYSPPGFLDSVRDSLDDIGLDNVYSISLEESDKENPLDYLYERFALNSKGRRSLTSIVENPDFRGKMIWVEGICAKLWPAWRQFLEDYSHASRSCSILERTVFCVLIAGEFASHCPAADVCLANHAWRGHVDFLDMILFSSSLLRTLEIPPVLRQLAIQTLARIALWDPGVARRLVGEGLSAILNPAEVLKEIGTERGWHLLQQVTGDGWEKGITTYFEGKEVAHSAFLALQPSDREIRRRLWSAQVAVIYPYIEEERILILDRIGHMLPKSFETRYGDVVLDRYDLELSHILHLVKSRNTPIGRSLLRKIEVLKNVRDALSHQRVLDPHEVLSREFLDVDDDG